MFVVIPTEIYDRITALLDGLLAAHPEFECERANIRADLVDYFDRTGVLPEPHQLSIEKRG